ncbi:patatin-like phospholipase [Legionella lansingensis]|uniref:Patatin-like phospholipase n=1 Tax=Legionella lansingensis TaxID=45067 RepID=A0A0W0VIX0_9GAMM|nr:patatin-like phospholipase family protein [Legionella lansingensis]KTD20058.1 patatin-like phospholipase [Legionella lansingensis]SNV50996.1 patatin-like phospholipase [Legionella lansingensis]
MITHGISKLYFILLGIFVLILVTIFAFILYHRSLFHRNLPAKPIAKPFKQHLHTSCGQEFFTILAIDGGGIRGIIPLYFLSKIEELTQRPISENFDLVAGISTGSIIATALTLPDKQGKNKFSAKKLLDFYTNDASKLFFNSWTHQFFTLDGLIGPKYSSTGIRKVGKKFYANQGLDELKTKVIVFGYDAVSMDIIPFCNWQNCSINSTNYRVRDVITGTTAMMSFFEPKIFHDEQGNLKYIINDMGMIMNNPTLLAYLYGSKVCPNTKHYLILSLGTGNYPGITDNSPNIASWGLIKWLPNLITTTIETHSQLSNQLAAKLARLINVQTDELPKFIYIRINPVIQQEQRDPLNISKPHLQELLNISEADYKKNEKLITCLVEILNRKQLSNACKLLISKNQGAYFAD